MQDKARTECLAFVLGRLLLVLCALGALAQIEEAELLERILPFIGVWIDRVDDTFRTVDLRLASSGGELVIVRLAVPATLHVVGNHVVAPDPRGLLSTAISAGIVLQPMVLAAALLFAWPWLLWRELFVRLAIAAPLMVLVMFLDVPTMLYGWLWNQEVAALDPDRFSPLILWSDFMHSGGRFALTAATVVIAVHLARGQGRPRLPGTASPRGS